MDVAATAFALVALGIGAVLGWLLAARRAEARLRTAYAESAALRAGLDLERESGARREEMLMRNGEVTAMLRPLNDSLARVGQQLSEVERGRAVSDQALREQVHAMSRASEHLHRQAGQLVTALRAPHVRGRWGEMQLERIVEAAGMTEHIDYETQVSTAGEGANQRPDLIVRLSAGRNVVVDAKVACSAYLEAMEATDEATRDARMKAHALQLRRHVDTLSAKAYWERFTPAPEFVVCFLPADTFLDAALREDPSLLEHAFTHNVVLATPSTLMALLRTIAYGWRQEALAANARQVHELGRDLYRRLATMGGHFDKLGRSLGSAVGAYNEAVGSMERMVLAKARQFTDLGLVEPQAQLPDLEPLTSAVPRRLSAPELLDPRVVTLPGPRTSAAAPPADSSDEYLAGGG